MPKDRVLTSLIVPRKNNPYPKPDDPENYEEFHTDLDAFVRRRLHDVFQWEYPAETIPATWNSITGGYLGILLGAKLIPTVEGIIGHGAYIEDWDQIDTLTIDRNSKWYEITMKQIDLLIKHKDKFLIMMPDFHGISDALVAIRGGENLCFDLYDNPEIIDKACGEIVNAWGDAYNEVYEKLATVQAGSTIWFKMWHPGKIEAIQEDFCDNLSPEQYETHFMKHDRAFCKYVDCGMFHLHNTMARLQEYALEMPEIVGTQFRPPMDETKNPDRIANHLDLYRRMHAAGKKTWYLFIDEDDMSNAILNGDPRHLYLIGRAKDSDSAKRILDKCCELTQKRIKELGL